jgi:hypothetical protein
MKPNLTNGYCGNRVEAGVFRGNPRRAKLEKVRTFVLTELISYPHPVAQVQSNKFALGHIPKRLAVLWLELLDKLLDILPHSNGGIAFHHLMRSTRSSANMRPSDFEL